MRKQIVATLGVWVATAAMAAGGVNVENMKTWTIVVPDDAIPSEKHAGQEFQSLFELATGFRLPIASAPARKRGNVFIGAGEAMKKSPVGFSVDALGEEGLRIRVKPHNIAIAGGRPRGTLYGVYEFFERSFGVRFLTGDHTDVPDPGTILDIPREDETFVPAFSFRWSYYKENSDQPEFAARLRINTVTQDEKLGGVTGQSLINHSLMKWINPAQSGQTHPEYFALRKGERKLDVGGGGPEPCVTHPEVIEIVAEGVIKELDANPQMKNISVSQNDNDEYCQCPRCEEINQREGTPMGSHLMFVNAVAERVEKKHPDVKIGTLAYWYTRKAPKTIVPRSNVQVQLCSIECCTFHAIDDPACPKNQDFCRDMQAWKAICPDIWVWNYNTDFSIYDLPFPNLKSIGDNVRFFLNNNVKGLFMQANGNGTSGEMSDLRNYVISRCIWAPGQESWPLVEEFCRLHYEDAGEPILAGLTLMHERVAATHLHPNCFPQPKDIGLTREVAEKYMACFDEAMGLAKSDAVRARVAKASIPAHKAMILMLGDDLKDHADLVHRYIDLCREHKMTMASEGQPSEAYFKELEERIAGGK